MINEHCRINKVICICKFSAILKILKSARRSNASLAVTSHLVPSLVLHPRFFLALASERLGLGCGVQIENNKTLYTVQGVSIKRRPFEIKHIVKI
jgi:hypothetical protein